MYIFLYTCRPVYVWYQKSLELITNIKQLSSGWASYMSSCPLRRGTHTNPHCFTAIYLMWWISTLNKTCHFIWIVCHMCHLTLTFPLTFTLPDPMPSYRTLSSIERPSRIPWGSRKVKFLIAVRFKHIYILSTISLQTSHCTLHSGPSPGLC